MTAEQIKIQKRVLKDIERSYEMTLSDINRYIRQAGSITVDVVKRLIRWNYFRNEDAVDIYYYEDKGVNNIIVTMDMFELHLWLIENYGIDIDIIDDIQEELNYLTTFYITSSQSERSESE